MKSKKFVLAGLVLLAITGLLPLAGCKNDSVPETPAAKLVSISVTTLPTRTVYSVGQSFDPTGMVVTATYNAGEPKDVTSLATTDFDFSSAGVKTVTVRYSEDGIGVSDQFEIRVLPTILTEGNWTYVEFGEWPQNIKDASVTVNESEGKQMGMFTYYLGDDDNYYVKHSDEYYKVEPIKWRVLTTSYKQPPEGGNALLLAESILTGGIPYYHFDRGEGGMVWSGLRIIGGKEIYPYNYEHSQIRAWLNGLSYQSKESEGATQSPKDEYKNAGFLQTAFTESAQKLIELTSVDNSAASTTDKIFLLSQQEATNSEYGFGAYSEKDSTRIRVTTDYAKATGAEQESRPGYGGWWWLRSPGYLDADQARYINNDGIADRNNNVIVTDGGVVPALSISLGGN